MRNTIKILSLIVLSLVASTTYGQNFAYGKLKVRYEGTPTSPTAIAFNITVDKTVIYVNNPGYPPLSPTVTSVNRSGTASLGTTAILENPGATVTGYTAYSSYVPTAFQIRKGGQSYYTLTPTEISNLEYFYDSINIVANGNAHFTITHTFDGDDTVFLVTSTD